MATPVFDPNGIVRDIPDEQVGVALGAGGKKAVAMFDPQGTRRYVPEDQVEAATNAGGKLATPVNAEPKGFVDQIQDRATSDAQSIVDAPGLGGKIAASAKVLGNFNKDSLAGQAQGVGSTAYNLTNLANKGVRGALSFITSKETADKFVPAMNPDLPSFLKPKNPIQSIGKGEEQLAEFFVPGSKVAKANKAIEVASQASKLPKFLQTGLRVGGQAAVEGTSNAAVAKAQGGNALPAFLMGAGGKVAGEAASAVPSFLKNFASKQYEKVLAPATRDNKFLTNRVLPGLVEQRPTALTKTGFLENAASERSAAGQRIGDAVEALPDTAKVKTKSVIDQLEEYKNNFKVDGKVVDPQAIAHADELQATIHQFGPDVSYKSLNKVRQIFDKSVAQAKGFSGKTLAEGSAIDAKKEASNAIREELARNQPDIAKVNAEFNFWKNVEKVVGETAQRRTGQVGPLGDTISAVGGAVVGSVKESGGIGTALGYATGISLLRKALKSTAARTYSAATASKLADALVRGDAKAVSTILGRVGASAASAKSR